MARKSCTPEDIIRLLREAEVELAQGQPMVAVLKKLPCGLPGASALS